MKEQIVSLDTAKLAKEKGFNEPCRTSYNKNNEFLEGWEKDMYNSSFTTSFVAPTQSLLQKWLREVHNIHTLAIRPFDSYIGIVNGKIVTKVNTVANYTYEEALEIALQEGLKLIQL